MAEGAVESLGLYVHIPFCLSKCAYCDFPSFAGKLGLRDEYVRQVAREIRAAGQRLGRPRADSLFIGGGTPSLLTPEQMGHILAALSSSFDLTPGYEATCEANPGTLSEAFLSALRAGGVNRLSLGAQSADPGQLSALGRRHTWADVERSVQQARSAGFTNINLDLMIGLPGQTVASFEDTLRQALALDTPHLSCYALILEEGTPLQKAVSAGEVTLPEPEEERAMYSLALAQLEKAGLMRYEVSNFAKAGHACRHNVNCWRRMPYLGFGAAAHSLMPGGRERRRNPLTIEGYLAGEAPGVMPVTAQDAMFESVMLGLRMTGGVSLAAFQQAHGKALSEAFPDRVQQAVAKGLAQVTEDGWFRLTDRGMDLMNTVLVDFLPEGQ